MSANQKYSPKSIRGSATDYVTTNTLALFNRSLSQFDIGIAYEKEGIEEKEKKKEGNAMPEADRLLGG